MHTLPTIDLADFFQTQTKLEQRVHQADQALGAARIALGNFNSQSKEELLKRIALGETTGDTVKDAAISIVGLDFKAIEAIVAFNTQLTQSKGQYILLAFGYEVTHRHVLMPTPEFGNISEKEHVYVLGILTGEGLTFEKYEENNFPDVIIPVTNYVIWGGRNTETHRVFEPLRLKGVNFSQEPNSPEFISAVAGINSLRLSMHTLFGKDCSLYIGELDYNKIRAVMPITMELIEASHILRLPTPAELAQGAHI